MKVTLLTKLIKLQKWWAFKEIDNLLFWLFSCKTQATCFLKMLLWRPEVCFFLIGLCVFRSPTHTAPLALLFENVDSALVASRHAWSTLHVENFFDRLVVWAHSWNTILWIEHAGLNSGLEGAVQPVVWTWPPGCIVSCVRPCKTASADIHRSWEPFQHWHNRGINLRAHVFWCRVLYEPIRSLYYCTILKSCKCFAGM